MRKIFLGFVYLLCLTGLAALEIWKHSPADLTGMGVLAGGMAAGMGTVMWGNAQEHKYAGKPAPTP